MLLDRPLKAAASKRSGHGSAIMAYPSVELNEPAEE